MRRMELRVASLAELPAAARTLVEALPVYEDRATVLALSGPLGAGKTALAKEIAAALGITETVTSPTFALLNRYLAGPGARFGELLHMDAYRIDDLTELPPLGFPGLLAEQRALFLIEWPEQIAGALPREAVKARIEASPEGDRIFHIDGI